jgi:acetyl/propionyl-CoA carboxylase alpha subunit
MKPMDLEFRSGGGTIHPLRRETTPDGGFRLELGEGAGRSGSWRRVGPHALSILGADGVSRFVHLARGEDGAWHLHLDGRTWRLEDAGRAEQGGSGGAAPSSGAAINEQGEIPSPMPGKVVEVAVAVGDSVARGDLLLVLESMKMEHPVYSPVAGRVAELPLAVGGQAGLGDPLARLETGEGS